MVFRFRSVLPVLVLVLAVASAQARPDLNAFLNKRADTTAELVKQADTDPQVLDRYERHFSMGREEVLNYLGSLHPGRLEADGVYKVYSIPEAGYVKSHVGRIKKGTPMFFNASGDPVLVALCGNPVVEGKAPTMVTVTPDTPVGIGETHPVSLQPPTPEPEISLSEPPDIELPDVTPGHDNLGLTPTINALPLAGLAGLGAFGLFSSGGHHSGPPPVPEPATIIALALGSAMVVRRRKQR